MRAMVLLAYIRPLYQVEQQARDLVLDAAGRRVLRQERSVPILTDIEVYLKREQPHVLPKSPIGEAIAYALGNWTALVRYTEDGNLEIDNNAAERSLRGVAVGRKNWLFFGSDTGGHPHQPDHHLQAPPARSVHLRAGVFDRISAHPVHRIEELLPDRWQAARTATTSD